jgi:hypothetical protein
LETPNGSAGPTRADSNSPASVSPTLLVVRFITNAEPFFQVAQPLTEAGNRNVPLWRGAPEIPRADDGDEAFRPRKFMSLIVRYIEQGILDCPA